MLAVILNQHLIKRRKQEEYKTAHSSPPDYETKNIISSSGGVSCAENDDYNNYAGSQLVMAEVINVEGIDNKNINVAYRYNIAGKEYESDKIQYTEKIRKGDKKEIRVKKDSPEVILKCD